MLAKRKEDPNIGYFILKQERMHLIENYLSEQEKAELLDSIVDYVNNGEASPRSECVNILYSVLVDDHHDMVDDFFGAC